MKRLLPSLVLAAALAVAGHSASADETVVLDGMTPFCAAAENPAAVCHAVRAATVSELQVFANGDTEKFILENDLSPELYTAKTVVPAGARVIMRRPDADML